MAIKRFTTLKLVDLISYGEIEGLIGTDDLRNIFINDAPVKNSANSYNIRRLKYGFRNGTQSQNPLLGFNNIQRQLPGGLIIPFDREQVREEVVDIEFHQLIITISMFNYFITRNPTDELAFPMDSFLRVEVIDANNNLVETVDMPSSHHYTKAVRRGLDFPTITNKNWAFPITLRFRRTYLNKIYTFHTKDVGGLRDFRIIFNEDDVLITQDWIDNRSSLDRGLFGDTLQLFNLDRRRAGNVDEVRARFSYSDFLAFSDLNISIDALNFILPEEENYANYAVCALELDSRSTGEQISKRSYLVRGRKVTVPNHYPNYIDLWDGSFKAIKEYSNNPAWVLLDILTDNHAGFGGFIDRNNNFENIDIYSLYSIARYCDEEVVDLTSTLLRHKRFTCNVQITKANDALNTIQNFCSIFHGYALFSAGKISFYIDKNEDVDNNPPIVINQTNVVDGYFKYSTTPRENRYNRVIAHYNDPDDLYKKKQVMVEDEESIEANGERLLEITAFACTSKGQAIRHARYKLYTAQLETELVEYATGLDHINYSVGEVIQIADPYLNQGRRLSGRIISEVIMDATTICLAIDMHLVDELRRLIDLTANPHFIEFKSRKDKFVRLQIIDYASSERNLLKCSIDADYTDDAPSEVEHEFDHPFNIYQATAIASKKLYRIMSIKEETKATFSVIAKQYNEAKFEAIDNPDFDFSGFDYTSLFSPLPLPPVQNLRVSSERPYIEAVSTFFEITISWEISPISNPSGFRLYSSKDLDDSFLLIYEGNEPSFTLRGVSQGTWFFRVIAYNSDRLSPANTIQVEIDGIIETPTQAINFRADASYTGITLIWDKVVDPYFANWQYNVYMENPQLELELIERNYLGTYLFIPITRKRPIRFIITAVNDIERESEVLGELETSILSPPAPTFLRATNIRNTISYNFYFDFIEDFTYEIRFSLEDNGWDEAFFLALNNSPFSSNLVLPNQNIHFYIKSKSSVGVYSQEYRKFTLVVVEDDTLKVNQNLSPIVPMRAEFPNSVITSETSTITIIPPDVTELPPPPRVEDDEPVDPGAIDDSEPEGVIDEDEVELTKDEALTPDIHFNAYTDIAYLWKVLFTTAKVINEDTRDWNSEEAWVFKEEASNRKNLLNYPVVVNNDALSSSDTIQSSYDPKLILQKIDGEDTKISNLFENFFIEPVSLLLDTLYIYPCLQIRRVFPINNAVKQDIERRNLLFNLQNSVFEDYNGIDITEISVEELKVTRAYTFKKILGSASIPAQATVVNFPYTFFKVPVNVVVYRFGFSGFVNITNITKTSFTVEIRTTSGILSSATLHYFAEGY